jgi:hypothetical protein
MAVLHSYFRSCIIFILDNSPFVSADTRQKERLSPGHALAAERLYKQVLGELRHSEGDPNLVSIGQRDQSDRFQPKADQFYRFHPNGHEILLTSSCLPGYEYNNSLSS